MATRWIDPYLPKDTRSGEEIAQAVVRGAGLKQKGGEE